MQLKKQYLVVFVQIPDICIRDADILTHDVSHNEFVFFGICYLTDTFPDMGVQLQGSLCYFGFLPPQHLRPTSQLVIPLDEKYNRVSVCSCISEFPTCACASEELHRLKIPSALQAVVLSCRQTIRMSSSWILQVTHNNGINYKTINIKCTSVDLQAGFV